MRTEASAQIGARIKARRVEMRMSQRELGAYLGVTFQQIQKYENGKDRIPAERLMLIAEALRTDVRYFFGIDDRRTKGRISEELLKALGKLGASQELLSIVGSFGDTLDDADMLTHLTEYNANGKVLVPAFITGRRQ